MPLQTEMAGKSIPVLQGWLHKWTNILKGYRRRWFVLRDGKLSYYESPNWEKRKPRDTIELLDALILLEEPRDIVISDTKSKRIFRVRAFIEAERQSWVTALELEKTRAINKAEALMEEETRRGEDDLECRRAKQELKELVERIQEKLRDMTKRSETAAKLVSLLPEDMESVDAGSLKEQKQMLDDISEWLRDMQNSTTSLVLSSTKCVELVRAELRIWRELLQEREYRLTLEKTVEDLAKQNCELQEAAIQSGDDAEEYAKDAETQPVSEKYIVSNASGNVSELNILSKKPGNDSEIFSDNDSGEEREGAAGNKKITALVHDLDVADIKKHSTTSVVIPIPEVSTQMTRNPELEKGSGSKFPADSHQETGVAQAEGSESGSDSGPESRHVTVTEIVPIPDEEDPVAVTRRERRMYIPEKPNRTISVWSVLKNSIGKDLTKVTMPPELCEPLTSLQRLVEDYEYSELLDKAAACADSCDQMAHVAGFAVSAVFTSSIRMSKPFLALLGETYELDRSADLGWRCITEQVSDHPSIAGLYCEGRGWKSWQESSADVTFKGQYLDVMHLGLTHLEFTSTGYHYTWVKVPMQVQNLIFGTMFVENRGDMIITNHTTGVKGSLHFYRKPLGQRKVTGVVVNEKNEVTWVLKGIWDSQLEGEKVIKRRGSIDANPPMLETAKTVVIWKRSVPPDGNEKFYNFSLFACQLNEFEEGTAPTDSRRRPDVRYMEQQKLDEASELRRQLEEKQRLARKKLEMEAEAAAARGQPFVGYQPTWFRKQKDPITGKPVFIYAGGYWECKEKQDWDKCPDIFL